MSQSPLIGAFVPGDELGCKTTFDDKESQSPLIGAFVPGMMNFPLMVSMFLSQSPLIGAFVPGYHPVTKECELSCLNPL